MTLLDSIPVRQDAYSVHLPLAFGAKSKKRDLLFILGFPKSPAPKKNNCLYDTKIFFFHGSYLWVLELLMHSVFMCSMLHFRGQVVVQEYNLNS